MSDKDTSNTRNNTTLTQDYDAKRNQDRSELIFESKRKFGLSKSKRRMKVKRKTMKPLIKENNNEQ